MVPRKLPATLARALESPRLREVTVGAPRSDALVVAGERLLVTYRALAHTQGWVVGVVVPEAYYTRDLSALQRRFLLVYAGMTLLVLVVGGLALRQLRGSLGAIVRSTSRMRALDFAPGTTTSPFRDVGDVIDELERAKTSMRALGKYAPMDLVRDLYRDNREPALGGELREISLMFSDIEGFTTLSERLDPGALAEALGRYLEAMTDGVRSTGGTVDKFIGDAVMAFWNAPHPATGPPGAGLSRRARVHGREPRAVRLAGVARICRRCSRASGCTPRPSWWGTSAPAIAWPTPPSATA